MSKKTKSRAKEERRKKKRERKAAQQAQYQAWALDGRTRGSRRVRLKAKRVRSVKLFDHPLGPCGNVGCQKCNGGRVETRALL